MMPGSEGRKRGLWKPLSNGKFAYVDSRVGERGGVLLYKINGMHNISAFPDVFFVAKEVIHAEVSNKCVWVGVCTLTLSGEEPERFFRWDQSHSLVVPVTGISG